MRRLPAVVAALSLVAVASCGDDDDDEPVTPATGANEVSQGNVDVTSSIAEPGVPGSNLGAVASEAPYNPSDT